MAWTVATEEATGEVRVAPPPSPAALDCVLRSKDRRITTPCFVSLMGLSKWLWWPALTNSRVQPLDRSTEHTSRGFGGWVKKTTKKATSGVQSAANKTKKAAKTAARKAEEAAEQARSRVMVVVSTYVVYWWCLVLKSRNRSGFFCSCILVVFRFQRLKPFRSILSIVKSLLLCSRSRCSK